MAETKPTKQKRGRPSIWNTPEQFTNDFNRYLTHCKGKGRGWYQMPTKQGLRMFLHVTRETLNDYEKNKSKGFSDALFSAYTAIEEAWIQKLAQPYPNGAMYYLKNAFKDEWRDRYDHTNDGGQFQPTIVMTYGKNDPLAKHTKI